MARRGARVRFPVERDSVARRHAERGDDASGGAVERQRQGLMAREPHEQIGHQRRTRERCNPGPPARRTAPCRIHHFHSRERRPRRASERYDSQRGRVWVHHRDRTFRGQCEHRRCTHVIGVVAQRRSRIVHRHHRHAVAAGPAKSCDLNRQRVDLAQPTRRVAHRRLMISDELPVVRQRRERRFQRVAIRHEAEARRGLVSHDAYGRRGERDRDILLARPAIGPPVA